MGIQKGDCIGILACKDSDRSLTDLIKSLAGQLYLSSGDVNLY